MSSTDVVTRATGGDEAARRALYAEHHAAAFRLAYLLLQDACDAEEVVQDAFVYLFRNLHRYDDARGSIWAWLRVTLVSRCRNKRRRQQVPLVSLESLEAAGRPLADASSGSDPARAFEAGSTRRAIWEALQRVSAGARDAIILRYYEGLRYVEIAEILGCSPAAARARVAHGKLQLRRMIGGEAARPVRRESIGRPARVG